MAEKMFKVGDKLIYGDDDWYEPGTVVTVLDVDTKDTHMPYYVTDGLDEYWIESSNLTLKPTKNQRISALEKEVEALKEEVAALKKSRQGIVITADGIQISPKLTPNQQRAAIIEKAKEFITSSERKSTCLVGSQVKVNFYVNKKKRTVTVLVRGVFTNYLYRKAIAKCAPDDVFNEHIGKAIALGRALGLDVSEFEQAVQPTEFAVGQETAGAFLVFGKVIRISDGRAYTEEGTYWLVDSLARKVAFITDDTEAQYE